jgi:hypothetical protein
MKETKNLHCPTAVVVLVGIDAGNWKWTGQNNCKCVNWELIVRMLKISLFVSFSLTRNIHRAPALPDA